MSKKQKLELTWIGKDHRLNWVVCILVEDLRKCSHAALRVIDNDIFDKRPIIGSNVAGNMRLGAMP